MITLLILVFIMTLFYAAVSARMFTLVELLRAQGILLFGVAMIQLGDMNILNLMLVLSETLLFKAVAVPYFLKRTIRQNNIRREVEPYLSGFYSLLIVTTLIVLSFLLASSLQQNQNSDLFFTAAFSAILTGLFMIMTRKKIVTHIIGYVILENGIVLLSFSVGSEMPMAVNAGILLDILVSVLLFGFFLSKIRHISRDFEISKLSKLKD